MQLEFVVFSFWVPAEGLHGIVVVSLSCTDVFSGHLYTVQRRQPGGWPPIDVDDDISDLILSDILQWITAILIILP